MSIHLSFRLLGTCPGPVTDGTFAETDTNVSIQERTSRMVKVFILTSHRNRDKMNDSSCSLGAQALMGGGGDTGRAVNGTRRVSLISRREGLCRQADVYKPLKDCY